MSERVATVYAGGSAVSLGQLLHPLRALAVAHERDLTGEVQHALRVYVKAEQEQKRGTRNGN